MGAKIVWLFAFLAVGCTAVAAEDGAGTEASALRSAQCPAKIKVEIGAPRLKSDAQIKANIREQGMATDPAEVDAEFAMLAPWLAAARAEPDQTLTGTKEEGCSYRLRDGSGTQRLYGWFAESRGRHPVASLRMTADIADGDPEHGLFFSVPLASVSPTAVPPDPSRKGYLSAQDTTGSHSERPAGFSYLIGSVDAKITILE
jgi:hypothetical protein